LAELLALLAFVPSLPAEVDSWERSPVAEKVVLLLRRYPMMVMAWQQGTQLKAWVVMVNLRLSAKDCWQPTDLS
jgi:hypothetical protein